ncbi:hypothetical protein DAPPUDRAFT_302775 [Daphnia pulex]|uniref:28S ribosomal protein S22, mitochondrial n=1 Tax=Daphnia pulex TaxID=6669 RepID=E9GEQ0_DAPPU|nr:hypothetical protein DAPPUDRAFT_302775 [Daphnia pulex]CAG4640266.1 EOG090X0AW0 [Daphnia pulex]|eukprot:EFX81875.1 hypothetical protein DAPPUDRAFT_302775 [Daphnia pulex]
MATRAAMFTFSKFRYFPILKHRVAKFSVSSNLLNASALEPGYSRDPGEVFFKENVQTLLERLTGRDCDKVFHNRKLGERLEPPKYELLTQAEVDHVMAEMEVKLKRKLQMPPLLKERDPIKKIYSFNPELQGFDDSKYVFINISQGITNRNREVVVRDPNGVLREASWEERQRMCQIYFPVPGRKINVPKMFEEGNIQNCLDRDEFEFVLDRACAQFDPDDPEYISVTRKTYDFVDENTKYTSLRPTRHFGPMVLHLVLSKKMDNLLFHFINTKDIDAAANLVRLFHTVADDTSPTEVDEFQLIENYIQGPALKKPALELAWQSFLEIEKQRREVHSQQNNASN